jgi:hypothetical protein
MKVKIFSNAGIEDLEKALNKWLEEAKEKEFDIKKIKQSYGGDSMYALISIWYEEPEPSVYEERGLLSV